MLRNVSVSQSQWPLFLQIKLMDGLLSGYITSYILAIVTGPVHLIFCLIRDDIKSTLQTWYDISLTEDVIFQTD